MLCKDNIVKFDYKSKKNNAKHIFLFLFLFLFLFFIFKKKKKTYLEMHECYAMKILKTNKTKKQIRMVTKNKDMKHKDHVRKTQLD